MGNVIYIYNTSIAILWKSTVRVIGFNNVTMLNIFILKNFPMHDDRISMELPILY